MVPYRKTRESLGSAKNGRNVVRKRRGSFIACRDCVYQGIVGRTRTLSRDSVCPRNLETLVFTFPD